MRKVLFILGQFRDEDVVWMAENGRRVQLAGGDTLIRQGVHVPDLFIVLDGALEIEVDGVGSVARRASGEVVGEMSFVDKAPPSATVRAAEPTTVLALDKALVERRLASDAAFAARFYRALAIYLADRLRSLTAGGEEAGGLDPHRMQRDELDEAVLDAVSMAGLRFQDLLRTLAGGR